MIRLRQCARTESSFCTWKGLTYVVALITMLHFRRNKMLVTNDLNSKERRQPRFKFSTTVLIRLKVNASAEHWTQTSKGNDSSAQDTGRKLLKDIAEYTGSTCPQRSRILQRLLSPTTPKDTWKSLTLSIVKPSFFMS